MAAGFSRLGIRNYLRNILLIKSSIFIEILKSVSVERQMACCYHHCPIAVKFRKYCRHEHSRSRSHSAVIDLKPMGQKRLRHRFTQHIFGNSTVRSHGYRQGFSCLSCFFTQPFHETMCQCCRCILSQINLFSLNSLKGNSANIAAVLQLLKICSHSFTAPSPLSFTCFCFMYCCLPYESSFTVPKNARQMANQMPVNAGQICPSTFPGKAE